MSHITCIFWQTDVQCYVSFFFFIHRYEEVSQTNFNPPAIKNFDFSLIISFTKIEYQHLAGKKILSELRKHL